MVAAPGGNRRHTQDIGRRHVVAQNPGMLPLSIIEVQSGSYLGEDDIVRFEDRYGRTPTEMVVGTP